MFYFIIMDSPKVRYHLGEKKVSCEHKNITNFVPPPKKKQNERTQGCFLAQRQNE